MKAEAIQARTTVSLWVCPADEQPRLEPGFVGIGFGLVPGEYSLRQQGRLVTIKPKTPREGYSLDGLLRTGRARLATVEHVSNDGDAALLAVRFFNGAVEEVGEVDVGIDDRALAAARKALRRHDAAIDAVLAALTELCVLTVGERDEDPFFLLTAGPAAAADFEARAGADGETVASPVAFTERAFSLQGEGIRIAVARRRVGPGEEKFLATRITSALGADPDGAVRLARGRLIFSDFTRTGAVRALAAGTMSKLIAEPDGYLRKWDEYGALEGEMLLASARRIGMLRWTSAEQVRGGNGVRFLFEKEEDLPAGLGAGDSLEFVTEEPDYLAHPEMTWADYSARLESAFEQAGSGRGRGAPVEEDDSDGAAQPGAAATVLEVADRSLVVDFKLPPEAPGLALILSLAGERVQIERRMEARLRILAGRSANPLLGLLIEEQGVPPDPIAHTRHPPLTAFVREKIFRKHPPTPRQLEAIDKALNTPDIALIQGPPGTGKTTVIAAIVERLNELADKGKPLQGQVLLTAFQHDAIENMLARLTVNSLPVPKFGQRWGRVEVGDRNADGIRRWCDALIADLRTKNPQLAVAERLREAQLRCHEYVGAPSLENAIATLDAFLALPDDRLSDRLAARTRDLRERLEHERSGRLLDLDDDLLPRLWCLRTSVEGFLDDGPAMARILLDRIGGDLPAEDRKLLERAATWMADEPPPFLEELRPLKGRIVEWYRPQATFRIDKPRKDVLEIVGEASQELQGAMTSIRGRTDAILAEFLRDMEGAPVAARRAVEAYAFAFAATCQASRGKHIRRRKERVAGDDATEAEYDTVIVDEAARTSPRDLLIPMAQAQRRIILVGDHRQLPHLINEEIARTLESGGDPEGQTTTAREASFVRDSMFQYLLSRLKKLEARDGFKRWVTLDQQYRMHPLLGQFVSDSFYRAYEEAFESPLPADQFLHGLPGVPEEPVLWLDLPAAAGEEERAGTSRRRVAEANLIASWIKRWIDTPAGRRLTYGVISFYGAQVEALFRSLGAHGFASRDEAGWRIAEDYRFRPPEERLPAEERVRVGTVDSFQGMEFDVVFLSMVRSRRELPQRPEDTAERARWEHRVYGHLTSPNRLCVSMSRQKRLLVVVGDRAMVERVEGASAVPGLASFLSLCEQRGRVVPWGKSDG